MATVALVQLEINDVESVEARIARAVSIVDEQTADLVVLPELWHCGAFDVEKAREYAEPIDGPLVTTLSETAARNKVWLHGGSFTELANDGEHYNTSVFFDPNGNLVCSYRKIHLFGFDGGETELMSGGEELIVVDTPLGPTGIATCYDLRFPEMFRALNEGGAEAFLLCSGWPGVRINHWDALTVARAIENQVWVVACNEVGTHAGVTLGGHSTVVDPLGEVIARGGDREEVVLAEVDPSKVASWRAAFPAQKDRRF